MKLTHKLIIWTSALCLVITTLFFEINFDFSKIINNDKQYTHKIDQEPMFKLIDVVNIQFNDSMVLDTKALSLKEIIIGAITLATVWVYNGMAVFHIGEVTDQMLENYKAWYQSKLLQDPTEQARLDAMVQYVEDTNQDVSDGNVVLPKEYVRNQTDLANMYIHSSTNVNTNFRTYAYTYKNATRYHKVPVVENQNMYVATTDPYLKFYHTVSTVKRYVPMRGTDKFSFTKSLIQINSTTIRIKIDIKYNGKVIGSKWSVNIDNTSSRYSYFINNVDYQIGFEFSGNDVWLYYYAIGPTVSGINNNAIGLTCITQTDQLCNQPYYTIGQLTGNQETLWSNVFVPNNGIFGTRADEEAPTAIPDYVDGNVDNDYYYVPTPEIGTTTPPIIPPVTPVPEESEYLYVVPTYTGLPTDGTWTDIENPVLTIPLPGVDDLLDGTFMKDLWAWFGNWLSYALNGIMDFWNAFVNNLFTGINNLTEPVKAIFNTLGTMKENWDTVWALITGKEATYNGESFNFNELYCEILPGQKLNWFEQIIFGLVCQSSNAANAISGFFEYIINIIIYITGTLVTSITAFVSSLVALLDILPNGIKQLFVFITSSLTILLTVKFVRYILDLIGALPIL